MKKDFSCPGCGAAGSRDVQSRVCVSKDSVVRDDVLSGAFFEWQCPQCSKRYFADDVLLYNDDTKKFMVYYVPGLKADAVKVPTVVKTDKDYDVEGSLLRASAEFVEFTEKIRVLEEGLDDRATEAIKAVYSSAYAESGGEKIYNIIFEEADERELRFSVFLEEEDFEVGIPREAYEKTKEDFSSLFSEPEDKRFLRIDQKWLKKSLGGS